MLELELMSNYSKPITPNHYTCEFFENISGKEKALGIWPFTFWEKKKKKEKRMCFKDIAFMHMHDIQLYDSLKDMPFFIYICYIIIIGGILKLWNHFIWFDKRLDTWVELISGECWSHCSFWCPLAEHCLYQHGSILCLW